MTYEQVKHQLSGVSYSSAIDNYNFDNTEKLNEDFYNAQVEAKKILGEYESKQHSTG